MSRGPLPCAALTVLAAILFAVPSAADDTVDVDAKGAASLVRAFVTLCVQSMGNLDQVERSASGLGWKKLAGAEARQFAAPAPDAKTTTWEVAHYASVPFWLSITRGAENGKNVFACTLINSDAPVPPVKADLVDMLGLKQPFREETIGTQDYTYWQTKVAALSVIVSLTNASQTTAKGINLGATLIQKPPTPSD